MTTKETPPVPVPVRRGVVRLLLPKINAELSQIIDPPAELRPRGWFVMFPQQTYPTIVCPQCGEISDLSGHKIEDDGTCSPSLVCPNDKCGWHVFARLVDWQSLVNGRLQETTLRELATSEDTTVSAMAYEILELRQKVAEFEPDEFKELVVYACLGLNLGHEIANVFQIPVRDVKMWALGKARPHPSDIDEVHHIIEMMIEAKKRKK